MISFALPWALAGLAAALVPILLHLFARREPETVVFPATRYLAETARAHHRRLTLQHWLLLLVRTLLIVALVLAAAGPTWPKSGVGPHAPTAVAIVLDNSLSSAATAGGTPVLDSLKAAARAILESATAADGLWLLTADTPPRRGSEGELRAAVDALPPAASRLDLGEAVSLARTSLAGDGRPGSVVVLSDLQATAFSAAAGEGPVAVARPAGAAVPNLGLAKLDVGRQPWGPEGGRVTATLEGTNGARAAVSIRAGARPPRRQLGTAGGTVTLPAGPLPAGWWVVRGELEPDELRSDDTREAAVRVAPAARAAWRAEDRFLAAALEVLEANGRLGRGNDVTVGSLGPGASVVIPPADPAALGAVNRQLAARGVPWRFGDLLPAAATDSGALLGRHQILRRHALVPQGGAPRGVLVTAAGAPWLVRAGTPHPPVLLLGSRLEPAWTPLPVAAEFVPFVDQLVNRLARGDVAFLETAPGVPVLVPDDVTAAVRNGERRELEGGGGFTAAEPGVFWLLAGRDTVGAVAVNPDPRESRLEPAEPAAVRRLWRGARVVDLGAAAGAAFRAGAGGDLRGPLLWLALLLGLGEVGLASARRR